MKTEYIYYRPTDAHPQLPVHCERVTTSIVSKFEKGREILTEKVRRDWVGSFPTVELAQGRVAVMQDERENH